MRPVATLTPPKTGTVFLVGAGPGDPGLLTVRGLHVLQAADVVLYDALASDAIVALASPTCEKIFVGKRGGKHAMAQDEIEALMVRLARSGKRVVRLKGGDPFVFGRGGEEAQTLSQHDIPFEIVPGISSAIAAPAYAGIPITHRDYNPAFTVITGHEDPTKPVSTLDFAKLADPNRTLVFLMAMANLEGISAQLQAHGLAGATPAAVIADGTRPTQRVVTGTLETIAADAQREGVSAPAVVIIGGVVGLREQLRWFDAMPLFGKRVLVTRPAGQAVEFADLLRAHGAEPLVVPTIAIESIANDAPARVVLADLRAFKWIVFSSRNAVEAAFGLLNAAGRDARAFGGVKIAAVGPQTAASLWKRGLRADLVPAEFVADELADALVHATTRSDAILLVGAIETRDVLPATLQRAGRNVSEVAVYQTKPRIDGAIVEATAHADVLTFASSSAVAGFIANHSDVRAAARGKVVACIGPVTSQTASAAGLDVDVTATAYTTDGLVASLEEYFRST
jgi:uroporphyrinogen III methyltransferase/synthase